MPDDTKTVLALDIYGTILDTNRIASSIQTNTRCSTDFARRLSELWRRYQLEYTWRLNSIGLYEPFDVVTKNSLKHAAAELELPLSDDTITALVGDYNHLLPFEDAVPAIQDLKRLGNVDIVIFSNGTNEMVTAAVNAALPQELLPLPLFLVDSVKRYKPAPEVYKGLLNDVSEISGARSDALNVWLVSGNPFDVTGARAAGLGAIWIDRAGKGWTDQLPLPRGGLGGFKIIRNLRELITVVDGLP